MTFRLDPLGPQGLVESDPIPPDDRVLRPAALIERLYRGEASRLRRFFARRSGGQDADDLVSESFVRLAGSKAIRHGGLDSPQAYLQEVATNVLRSRARAAYQQSIVTNDVDRGAPERALDPTAALEARDMLVRMQAALDRLPPKTRAIFMAHRLDGVTYAELASAHELSVKGIEWHMSKAIAHLHRAAGKK